MTFSKRAAVRPAVVPCLCVPCLCVACLFVPGCSDSADGPAASSERVAIDLVGGDRIEGRLLKRDEARLYLYVGGSMIEVEHTAIKRMKSSERGEADLQDVKKLELYRTARRQVKSVQAHVDEVGPAIVVVKTPAGLGTGWFCNKQGYVVTNNHVVAGERSVTVTMFRKGADGFGKKVFKKVKIIALNDDIDLALLKIEEKIDIDYPQLYIGDSTKVHVGDSVFAVGNPVGLERSTSQGIVSKSSRNMAGRLYIQTDAALNPGNSGGPLFNERGEIVGIVNMGYIFMDGLGFAIPSKYIKEFLDNVDAFAYDEDNPNSGMQYMEPPISATDGSIKFTAADFIKAGSGIRCLTLADMDGDGVKEILFVNNSKAEVGVIRRRRKDEVEEKPLDDFEDINRLRESERFKVVTTAVTSKITSLAVDDRNGDGRPDIVFLGDIDGLAVLEQKEDGTFAPARKIDDVKPAERRTALKVEDIDGDGTKEIFVLGEDAFSVFRGEGEREEYPLNGSYKSKIKWFELVDMNGDGRLDVLFFSTDKHYAAHLRLQNAEGRFIEEHPIRSHLSGPVRPYPSAAGSRFLTLDAGLNRARELVLRTERREPAPGEVACSLLAVPVDPAAASASDVELGDIDGDGALEMLVCDGKKNEFVVYARGEAGFSPVRSPSPRGVSELALHVTRAGKAVAFSFSGADKIFGVSRIDAGKVAFPRPINTEGQVQYMSLEKGLGPGVRLLWIEKVGTRYFVRTAAADALAQRAFDGRKGSIDIPSETFSFGPDAARLKDSLAKRPSRLAFADFNSDGKADLVMYWSYSGRESLYAGLGGGGFGEVIKDQKFLEEQKDQPLVVEDIDGDGAKDVLLVMPGFVRQLKVDGKGKLYVERQFNWKFDKVKRLSFYEKTDRGPRFVAVAGRQAKIVELDVEKGGFRLVGKLDLSGMDVGGLEVGDLTGNGKPDILMFSKGAITIFRNSPERWAADSRVVFNAKLDYFTYWNAIPADLDGDGRHEVLLFDSKKSMFEVYRPDEGGELQVVLRHRLFEKTIFQRRKSDTMKLPQELEIGDVDGNGKADLVCILQDRVAIYLQGAE